jgi:hypothetical protein
MNVNFMNVIVLKVILPNVVAPGPTSLFSNIECKGCRSRFVGHEYLAGYLLKYFSTSAFVFWENKLHRLPFSGILCLV